MKKIIREISERCVNIYNLTYHLFVIYVIALIFDTANVKAIAKQFEKYWDLKPTSQKHEIKGKKTGMYDFFD